MQINLRRETLRLTRAGMLAAAAIALSAAESLFPALPFLPPGAKPGFSNLACMLAASGMGLGPAFSVAVMSAPSSFIAAATVLINSSTGVSVPFMLNTIRAS